MIAPILKALATAAKRERKSFGSFATNNLFLAALALPGAGAFVFLLGALIILFPLSADPLRKIPADRLPLWPLSKSDLRKLRMLTPWLNPLTWALLALALWTFRHNESLGLLGLLLCFFAIGFFAPSFGGGEPFWLRWLPAGLVGKSIREMLLTLDVYVALLLSLACLAYRVTMPALPAEAMMAMTLLVVLAISSYAQCLFGLESSGGRTRYQLLPLPGWRILAAKDIAYLSVAVILTLPLAPLAGLAGALTALTFGHAPSVEERREQTRWRFSSGVSIPKGILQTIAIAGACVTAYRISLLILIPCALACAGTTWWYGRKLC